MIVDIQSKNAQIAALVDGSNAASSDDGKGSFKCGSSK
jgi:hypothetical protein